MKTTYRSPRVIGASTALLVLLSCHQLIYVLAWTPATGSFDLRTRGRATSRYSRLARTALNLNGTDTTSIRTNNKHASSSRHPVNSDKWKLLLEKSKSAAEELLNEQSLPPGSYTRDHYKKAKQALDTFKNKCATDSESVHLSIRLLERLVTEMAIRKDTAQMWWICEPRYFNSLFNLWKEAAKQGKAVISPQNLVQKLQTMSRTLPEFNYNIVGVGIIMDVLIKQAPTKKAPFIAEELLNFVRKEAAEMKNVELRPNVFIYNNLLQAWAVSGLPEAPDKFDGLLQTMHQEGVPPNELTYNILLRYWCTKFAVDKIDSILETMKDNGLEPSTTSMSHAIHAYVNVGKTNRAEELLHEMLKAQPKSKKEAGMIPKSVQNILFAYRAIVDNSTVHPKRKEEAVVCAKALFENIRKCGRLTDEDQSEYINCTCFNTGPR